MIKVSKKAVIILVAIIVIGIMLKIWELLSLKSSAENDNAAVAVIMPGIDTAKPPYFLIFLGILIVLAAIVILYKKYYKK